MKALVVYDSAYGNTEQIARTIAEALRARGEVILRRVAELRPEHLQGLDLLLVGSPTQRFNMLPTLREWVQGLPAGSLRGLHAAAFDTRFPPEEIQKIRVLAFFAGLAGKRAFAAGHIERGLKQKGAALAAPGEGFFVGGMEGPLLEGELERAAAWAAKLGGT